MLHAAGVSDSPASIICEGWGSFKGQVTFFETLSVGIVPGTDHSLINNRFQAEKSLYIPVPT